MVQIKRVLLITTVIFLSLSLILLLSNCLGKTAQPEDEGKSQSEDEGQVEGESPGKNGNEGGLVISVTEQHGIERIHEYVSCGVPLPQSWNVTDVSSLKLSTDDNIDLPAQFEVLARWGASPEDITAPVKWVLVGFFIDIPAGSDQRFIINTDGPGPLLSTPIAIDDSATGKMLIDTGSAQFTILTDSNFNLFDQVTLDGQTLLDPLSSGEAISYEPAGSLSIVPGGSPDFTPRTTIVTIERDGPLCAVLRVEGSILDSLGRALLDFTARLHFFSGDSHVRVDFTLENNQPLTVIEGGQPGNAHELGAINSVYIGSLSLNLRLLGEGTLGVLTEDDVDVLLPEGTVRLYQDSSGTDMWDNYVGLVGWPGSEVAASPRLQSFCLLPGYQISGPGIEPPITGDQALGWMSAGYGEEGQWINVAIRDFWQNFPKAIEISHNGTVSIDLFPNGEQFFHNFRVGEEKTHSFMLDFGQGTIAGESAQRTAAAFNHPLRGITDPDWNTKSGVLGPISSRDTDKWPLYENFVNTAFEPNPDFDPGIHGEGFGNRSLLEVINDYNFYGWQDYGDVPLDYEAFGQNQAGQMNLKYWYTYGMFQQLLRSGDLRWYDLALPAAWHLADVDYLHIPDSGIAHWAHGAYFGHSQHDEPGNMNPNRNYNSPSVDLFFGIPDLLLAYYLTGERRFADVALEGLEAMENMSQFSDFTNPIPHRERANLIFAYIEGYRYTGDERWLNDLRDIVAETANTTNKPWLDDPTGYRPGGEDQWLSSFSLCQVLWSMSRYLDFLEEYGLEDDLGVTEALAVYGDFILDHDMVEYREGYAATHNAFWFFDPGWDEYLEINNWALLTADVLAYAYRYSGQERFIEAAALFYETGVTDPNWEDDAPEYIDTKGLVNHLNWGMVYMNSR